MQMFKALTLAAAGMLVAGAATAVTVKNTGKSDVTIGIEGPSKEELVGDPVAVATAIRDAYFASLVRGAEKLGLRVEARKGPLEVLVVDSADRPTEN